MKEKQRGDAQNWGSDAVAGGGNHPQGDADPRPAGGQKVGWHTSPRKTS